MSAYSRSILMLLATMLIWGSTFVVTKDVIAQIPPFTLGFARVGIGALILLLYAAARRRRGGSQGRSRALPWRTLCMMGLLGVGLYYALFNLSMVYTSASQGALVQSSIPAITALVAVVWLREHASARRWTGIVLSIVGVLVVFSGAPGAGANGALLGNLLMFGTTVCWALYTSLAKRVSELDPVAVTAGVMSSGALMLLPAAGFELFARGVPDIGVSGWLAIAYLGALASGAAYLLYNAALKHMDASQVGVYTNLIPVVGVVSGVLILGEPLSARAILGGCVVLAGVWLTSTQAAQQEAADLKAPRSS